MKYIIIYLAVMSVVLLLTMGIDKSRAVSGKWRISERTLLLLALIGGGVGGVFGMILFRHKLRDPRFKFFFPFFALIQIAAVVLLAVFNVIPY